MTNAEDGFDYLAESARTASGEFFGDLVSESQLKRALADFAEAAKQLDHMKKALFYGRRAAGLMSAVDLGVTGAGNFAEHVGSGGKNGINVLHAILGITTEAGEFAEALLTGAADGTNLFEEIGDMRWYEAMLLRELGRTGDECERANIAKLRVRFPDKFTCDDANNRDLFEERQALEGDTEARAEAALAKAADPTHLEKLTAPFQGDNTPKVG